MWAGRLGPALRSGDRRLVDALDRRGHGGVEVVAALLRGEPLGEGTGEAGDDAVGAGQPGVRVVPGVATRERYDPEHLWVVDPRRVGVVSLGERELEDDLLVGDAGVWLGAGGQGKRSRENTVENPCHMAIL